MNNIEIGLANILLGFLITILCIPLVKRKIKMNYWYGMRIPKSFKSEENWYKINEYGGKIFIYWSTLIILIGIISLFMPPLGEKRIVVLSLAPFFIILATIQLVIYSRKI